MPRPRMELFNSLLQSSARSLFFIYIYEYTRLNCICIYYILYTIYRRICYHNMSLLGFAEPINKHAFKVLDGGEMRWVSIEKGARLSRFIVKAEVGTTRHLFEMSVTRRMPEDRRGREREIEREKVCLWGSLGIFSVFFGLLEVALRSSLLHSVLFGLPMEISWRSWRRKKKNFLVQFSEIFLIELPIQSTSYLTSYTVFWFVKYFCTVWDTPNSSGSSIGSTFSICLGSWSE